MKPPKLPAVTGHRCRSGDGDRYRPARGRYAPREGVEPSQLAGPLVLDLTREYPDWKAFWERVERELRIRFYRPKSIKNYRNALRSLALWFRRPPHELTSEDVRDYLLRLVERGCSSSWVAINISAIRTCFDKLGGLAVSEGIRTPRKPRRLPVVLSESEVRRILSAAPSLRDKALLGILYACGLRVSEACRLRWRDIDLERRNIRVWRGKGMKDRYVMLASCMEPLFRQGKERCLPEDFVFVGDEPDRHLSPRSAQRIMARAVRISSIGKRATPHSMRHSFATHLVEHGTDTSFIQELLGHARLETTQIYMHVAQPSMDKLVSPLDRLGLSSAATGAVTEGHRGLLPAATSSSSRFMDVRLGALESFNGVPGCDFAITVHTPQAVVDLLGSRVLEPRTGWILLEVPPLELWEPALQKLAPEDRRQVESAEFYERLRAHVTHRFLALRAARGSG